MRDSTTMVTGVITMTISKHASRITIATEYLINKEDNICTSGVMASDWKPGLEICNHPTLIQDESISIVI